MEAPPEDPGPPGSRALADRCRIVHGFHEGLAAALADCYGLERELRAGGMASLYLVEDLKHHRQVAVKDLRPSERTPRSSGFWTGHGLHS